MPVTFSAQKIMAPPENGWPLFGKRSILYQEVVVVAAHLRRFRIQLSNLMTTLKDRAERKLRHSSTVALFSHWAVAWEWWKTTFQCHSLDLIEDSVSVIGWYMGIDLVIIMTRIPGGRDPRMMKMERVIRLMHHSTHPFRITALFPWRIEIDIRGNLGIA